MASLNDDAAITFDASQTDSNSNIGSASQLTTLKDIALPNVAIDAVSTINNANYTAYTVTGSCTSGDGNISYTFSSPSGGSLSASVSCSAGSWTTGALNLVTLIDNAAITFNASQTDSASNSGVASQRNALKDIILPSVAIDAVSTINNANYMAYTVSGSCSAGDGNVNYTFSSPSGGTNIIGSVLCSASLWTTGSLNFVSLNDDVAIAFDASQTDSASNVGAAIQLTTIKVTSIPTVTITSSPPISSSNKGSYTVSGTCSEDTRAVNVAVGSISASDTCTSLMWSVTVDISGDADNPALAITADHDNNVATAATQATASVIKDTTSPTVAITSSPPINSYNKTSYTVSGTCSEDTRAVNIAVGSISTSDTCTSLMWSVTVDISGDADNPALAITADHDNNVATTAIQASTTVVKDIVIPSLSTVTAPAAGSYYTNHNVDFSVVFSENVIVTGSPSFQLLIDVTNKPAVYVSGSGTNTLIFRYIVLVNDVDANGIGSFSPISLNSGTIKDTAENNIVGLTFTPPPSTTVIVDGLAPAITSIIPPPDNTYLTGSHLDFILNYNTLINVTGIPRISINIGGAIAYATYLSGTGTTSLTFRYTANSAHLDSDGIVLISPVSLNSGTMTVPSSSLVSLTFSAIDTTGILVNEALSDNIDIPASAIYNSASEYTVLVKANFLCSATTVHGDLGYTTAGSLTTCSVTGTTDTPITQEVSDDLDVIYSALTTPACDQMMGGTLAGITLTSGVYCFAAAATLTGQLTLDAQGDPDAFFIIRIGGAMTATGFSVVMAGGGNPCNVYWGVIGATTATGASFMGNLVPSGAITMTGGSITGSLLSKAAVTLAGDANGDAIINGCPTPP